MPGLRQRLDCCSVHPRDVVHTGTGTGADIGEPLAVGLSILAAVDIESLTVVAGRQVEAHCIQVSVQEQPRVVGRHSLDRQGVPLQLEVALPGQVHKQSVAACIWTPDTTP